MKMFWCAMCCWALFVLAPAAGAKQNHSNNYPNREGVCDARRRCESSVVGQLMVDWTLRQSTENSTGNVTRMVSESYGNRTRKSSLLVSHWTTAATRSNVVEQELGVGRNESQEQDLLHTLGSKLLALSAPFDASRRSSVSSKCRQHTQRYLEALHNFELWAVNMYDAAAKLPSGLLSGNINNFGDFDQCLAVVSPSRNGDDTSTVQDVVRGQYCLAYLQPNVPSELSQPRLKQLHDLVQSHGAFRSDFDDPGHRVPRFSMINWALCVPAACSPADVEASLKETVTAFTAGTGIEMNVRVESDMCQVYQEDRQYDLNTQLAAYFFITIIAIVLASTLVEYCAEQPNPLWVAFSLRQNVAALCNLNRAQSDIQAVHGIRFLNAFLLVVSHKSMALFFDPYVNRTQMTESLGQSWTVIGRAAAIYTDVFLMFSGLLTSYSIIGRLQRRQPTRLVQEYVGRLLRIVPTFGALILFCTYILPNLASGPQWNLVVGHHADICKQHWWRNMLFIHNYFGFENMCLTHTHHLGIDTELFLLAPMLILFLWRWPRKGVYMLLFLAGISTVGRYYVSITHQLSNYVYFGASIKTLFRTADLMYAIPFYRATIYLLGILFGYVLRTFHNYKLTQTQLKLGWYTSSVLFVAVFLGPAPMGSITYVYNAYHAAVYAALGPMAWCGLFAWIVFTSHLGYRTWISDVMSWRGFLITTRLSYGIYLTQFPVFFFNVGRRRFASHFDFISHTLNVHEYFFIVLTSVVLTLFFETPFQNLKKIMFAPIKPAKTTIVMVQQQSPPAAATVVRSADSTTCTPTAVTNDLTHHPCATASTTSTKPANSHHENHTFIATEFPVRPSDGHHAKCS